MITWILVLLMHTSPYPVFAFLDTVDTEAECEAAAQVFYDKMKDDIDSLDERLGCMQTFKGKMTSI